MIVTEQLAEKAKWSAAVAHAGQVDKQGRVYHEHHLRPVANMARALAEGFGFEPDAIDIVTAVAWMHDILEDTPLLPGDLTRAGFPPEVVEAVDDLSHDAAESYADYIDDLVGSASDLVLVVKLADNLVNSTTLDALPADTATRLAAKYAPARVKLIGALTTKLLG